MIGREKPRTNARRLPPSDRADISGREEMRAASSHDAMEGVDSVLGEALETFSTWLMDGRETIDARAILDLPYAEGPIPPAGTVYCSSMAARINRLLSPADNSLCASISRTFIARVSSLIAFLIQVE